MTHRQKTTAVSRATLLPMVATTLVMVAFLTGCDGLTPGGEQSRAGSAKSMNASASIPSERPLTESEMYEAVREAIANPDTLDRVARLTALMQGLREENLQGAKNAFDEDMARVEVWEIRLFAAGLARIAPAESMDYVRTWMNPKMSAAALNEIIYGWTLAGGAKEIVEYAERTIIDPANEVSDDQEEDEVGRIALPTTNKKEKRPNYIISEMVRALSVAGEGDEVTRILASYPVSDKSTFVLSSAVIGFRRNGPETLEAWIKSIPIDTPNDVYPRVWNSAIGVQAKVDASLSAKWYEFAEETFDPNQGPLQRWTIDWIRKDPTTAILWLLERPENRDRFEAIRSGVLYWLKLDGPAASEWLRAEIDRPGLRAPALFPLTQYMMTVDIKESIALAERIPNPGERTRALRQSLMALAGRDPQAFKTYAETHEVPQKVLDTIEAHHGTKLREIGMPRLDGKG